MEPLRPAAFFFLSPAEERKAAKTQKEEAKHGAGPVKHRAVSHPFLASSSRLLLSPFFPSSHTRHQQTRPPIADNDKETRRACLGPPFEARDIVG